MSADTHQIITQKLAALRPQVLRVEDESHRHNVPDGAQSHFKVTVVSPEFCAKNLLARHRLVNEILATELAGGVHALALHTLTPDEWDARGSVADSPQCLGGSANEKANKNATENSP